MIYVNAWNMIFNRCFHLTLHSYKQQIHLANIFKNERIETSLSVNGSVLPNKFGLMGHY